MVLCTLKSVKMVRSWWINQPSRKRSWCWDPHNMHLFQKSLTKTHWSSVIFFGEFPVDGDITWINAESNDKAFSEKNGNPNRFYMMLYDFIRRHMGVSKNSGTTKSSILIGFSLIINHPFWGTPIFGNTHIQEDAWKKTLRLVWLCNLHRLGTSTKVDSQGLGTVTCVLRKEFQKPSI